LVFVAFSTLFAIILWPGFWNEIFPSPPKVRRPDIPAEWLKERISVEQAERAHSVRLEDLGPDPVPFGYQKNEWLELRSSMQPGDELWNYSSSAESWAHLAGRAGIAVVRNGTVVAHLVTLMN
jgi:hypothetical protein